MVWLSWITRPATVTAWSSGRSQSSARFRSRTVTSPSTLTQPSGWRRTPWTEVSCSSSISPTISSRMSSSVTSPCRAPYSSTTRAKWVLRLRKALSWSFRLVVSGMNHGSRVMAPMSISSTLPPASAMALARSLACSTPTMFSVSSLYSGRRVKGLSSARATRSRTGRSASIIEIEVRWTMISETSMSDRSSTPPSMRRSRLSTAPSEWWYSTAPRISSCAASTSASMSSRTPNRPRVRRTIHWMAYITGPSRRTSTRIGAESARATSSARTMARVLGSTSTNTTTSTVITTVARKVPRMPGTAWVITSVAITEAAMLKAL